MSSSFAFLLDVFCDATSFSTVAKYVEIIEQLPNFMAREPHVN
jgi:hypothetical protein